MAAKLTDLVELCKAYADLNQATKKGIEQIIGCHDTGDLEIGAAVKAENFLRIIAETELNSEITDAAKSWADDIAGKLQEIRTPTRDKKHE